MPLGARHSTCIDDVARRGSTPAERDRKERRAMTAKAVQLLLYRWAGQWGPFSVSIPCGECSLTADVIKDTLATELAGIPVEVETREWLTEWWKPLPKGGWHAPDSHGGGQGREPGPCPQPRRAHRGGHRRARRANRGVRQPSVRQGDLPPLRAGEGLLRRCRHRPRIPRRGQGSARALRNARPGEAHRRAENLRLPSRKSGSKGSTWAAPTSSAASSA